MRLSQYLFEKNLGYSAFGKLIPAPSGAPTPRVTVRQWSLGLRFPSDPAVLVQIEAVTGGLVTAKDFADHVAEQRRAA